MKKGQIKAKMSEKGIRNYTIIYLLNISYNTYVYTNTYTHMFKMKIDKLG